MELARHLPASIHRFCMYLKMTENEERDQEIEREVMLRSEKQNATWNLKFVITSTSPTGIITFSTEPASVLQETYRIICSLSAGLCDEEHIITLGGSIGMLCEPQGFFAWYDIKHFIKLGRGKDNLKVCFDIIDIISNENAAITGSAITDLKMLPFFESGDYSDITIASAKKQFKAHKLVLAARSPVFAAMFNDKQKICTGKITISDLKPEVLEEMLRYMYSNNSTKIAEMPCKLLAAAHMYDFQDLKSFCVDHLLHHVRVENVVEILKVCDTYSLESVKEQMLNFIDINEALVMKQNEYQEYLKVNVSVENLTKNLVLAQEHELPDFKLFLFDFIAKNYAKVIQNQKYRLMYFSGTTMELILEVDEYIANYIKNLCS